MLMYTDAFAGDLKGVRKHLGYSDFVWLMTKFNVM